MLCREVTNTNFFILYLNSLEIPIFCNEHTRYCTIMKWGGEKKQPKKNKIALKNI